MTTENNASKTYRQIAKTHRPHLHQIAEIFVSCSEHTALSEARVRELIRALPRFGRASFRDWAGNPEWQEAVDAARENAAIKRDLEQRQRGKIMFRWALDMLNHLTKDHQRAVDEQRPEDACRLEDRICKLNKLLAEEETRLAQNEKQDNDEKSSVTLIFEGPEDGTVPPDES